MLILALALMLADSPQLDRCLAGGAAAEGQSEAMAACYATEYRRVDGALNRAYGAARQRLSPARRAALQREERGWIASRDATCRQRLGPDKGTIQRLEFAACLIDQTRARTTYLQRLR